MILERNNKFERIIIIGMPCSGKSTTSKFVSSLLDNSYFIDEGTNNHPADFEFDAFLTEDDLSA